MTSNYTNLSIMETRQEVNTNREANAISNLVDNNEAIMNRELCVSVAHALLKLKEKYPIDGTTLEQLEQQIILAARLHFPQYPEYITAIQNFIKRAKEPLNRLDIVTLTVIEEGQAIEKEIAFPLKEVLFLVWRALNDTTAYTDHYPGGYSKKIDAARRDLPKRLETLFNAFTNDSERCHLGLRNATVASANKIHAEVNLLEDAATAIIEFSKDWISHHFWDAWQHSDAERQKIMLHYLWQWMENGDTTGLLEFLQDKDNFFKELSQFFLSQGINFTTLHIGSENALSYTNGVLRQLAFPCNNNPDNYPLEALNFILGTPLIMLPAKQKKIILIMRDWVKNSFQLTNAEHAWYMELFKEIYEGYCLLTKHKEFYNIFLSQEWIEEHITLFQNYFNTIISSCNEASLSGDDLHLTLEKVQAVKSQIANVLNNNEKPVIENFFANWFLPRSAGKAQNYVLLLNASFCNRISWSDESMRSYQMRNKSEENDGSWSIALSTYEINRFFLHALTNPPATWSPLFSGNFAQVLTWVKEGFDQPESERAQALKRSSYPYALLDQLTYLLSQSPSHNAPNEAPIRAPYAMPVLLPEHCKDVESICFYFILLYQRSHSQREFISRLALSEEEFREISHILLVNLGEYSLPFFELYPNSWEIIKSSIKSIRYLKLYIQHLGRSFFEKYEDIAWVKNIITSDEEFEAILDAINSDDRIYFLDKFFAGNIVFDDLNSLEKVRRCIPTEREAYVSFFSRITNLPSLVKNFDDLRFLLGIAGNAYAPKFMENFDCVKLASNCDDFEYFFDIRDCIDKKKFDSILREMVSHVTLLPFLKRITNHAHLSYLLNTCFPWFNSVDETNSWPLIMNTLKGGRNGLRNIWAILKPLSPEQQYISLQKLPEWPNLVDQDSEEVLVQIFKIYQVKQDISFDNWLLLLLEQANDNSLSKKLIPGIDKNRLFNVLENFGWDKIAELISTGKLDLLTVLKILSLEKRYDFLRNVFISSSSTLFKEQRYNLLQAVHDWPSLFQPETSTSELIAFIRMLEPQKRFAIIQQLQVSRATMEIALRDLFKLIEDGQQRFEFIAQYDLWQAMIDCMVNDTMKRGDKLELIKVIGKIAEDKRVEFFQNIYKLEKAKILLDEFTIYQQIVLLIPQNQHFAFFEILGWENVKDILHSGRLDIVKVFQGLAVGERSMMLQALKPWPEIIRTLKNSVTSADFHVMFPSLPYSKAFEQAASQSFEESDPIAQADELMAKLKSRQGYECFAFLKNDLGWDKVRELTDPGNAKEILALLTYREQIELLKELDLKNVINSGKELLELLAPYDEIVRQEIIAKADLAWIKQLLQEDEIPAREIAIYTPMSLQLNTRINEVVSKYRASRNQGIHFIISWFFRDASLTDKKLRIMDEFISKVAQANSLGALQTLIKQAEREHDKLGANPGSWTHSHCGRVISALTTMIEQEINNPHFEETCAVT